MPRDCSTEKIPRFIVTFILTVYFLFQCQRSLRQYIHPGVVTEVIPEYHEELVYPSLTFCPRYSDEHRFPPPDRNKTFDETSPDLPDDYIQKVFWNQKFYTRGNMSEAGIDWHKFWVFREAFFGCYTINPPNRKQSVGYLYPMKFLLRNDLESIHSLAVFVHSKDYLFVGPVKRLGNAAIAIRAPKIPNPPLGQKQISEFMLHIGKTTFLKTNSFNCTDEPGLYQNYSFCINSYFTRKLNCVLPWLRAEDYTNEPLRACNKISDVDDYESISKTLLTTPTLALLKELQCALPCTLPNYDIRLNSETIQQLDNSSRPQIQVELVIDSGVVEHGKERVLYTIDNLVADVGGYLGLLLGASILAFYEWLEDKLRVIFKKMWIISYSSDKRRSIQ